MKAGKDDKRRGKKTPRGRNQQQINSLRAGTGMKDEIQ